MEFVEALKKEAVFRRGLPRKEMEKTGQNPDIFAKEWKYVPTVDKLKKEIEESKYKIETVAGDLYFATHLRHSENFIFFTPTAKRTEVDGKLFWYKPKGITEIILPANQIKVIEDPSTGGTDLGLPLLIGLIATGVGWVVYNLWSAWNHWAGNG